jgi:hypothetical protein
MQLTRFLERSAATEAFRNAIAEFQKTGEPNGSVRYERRPPPIKVERTLTKILATYPGLPIERVTIDGFSGCELFRGHAVIEADGERRNVRFEWNCRWKAEQLGWTDWFGFPDQGRAAREFEHDCFLLWEEIDGDDERSAA